MLCCALLCSALLCCVFFVHNLSMYVPTRTLFTTLCHAGSNNTAELTAIGEALLWCSHHLQASSHSSVSVRSTALSSSSSSSTAVVDLKRVVIRYDSEYAAKSIQGIFNGKKNVELISVIRKHFSAVVRLIEVSFVHVKGHSKARWNDRADELAGLGASGQVCEEGRYRPGEDPHQGGDGDGDRGSPGSNAGGNSGSGGSGRLLAPRSDTDREQRTDTAPSLFMPNNRPPSILAVGSKRSAQRLPDSRFADSQLHKKLSTPSITAAISTSSPFPSIGMDTSPTATVGLSARPSSPPHSRASEKASGSNSIEVISLSSDDSESEDDKEGLNTSFEKKRKIERVYDISSP